MQSNICINCGGDYEYRNGRWICRACGSYKPEEISNEEVTLLYTASQKLRLADFDEAEQEFDDIVQKYPQNPNGYWGRLMSRYGIKYEEDFDGKRIPTCYATSIESLMQDPDYRNALKYADKETKAFYIQTAEYIDRVRKEWVEKARKEKPYDIFICYKDSDLANGIERTQDSIAAQDLYIHLTNKGYRVFYSHESLRDKAGEKYEPYIFSALSTAKVMLVYGSKPEYITSTWLKNEWTRYDKKIKAGEKLSNSLLVACDGFSPNALPKMLSSKQCLDANRRSFYSDLDAVIERIMTESKSGGAGSGAGKPEKRRRKAPVFVTLLLVAALAVGGYVFLNKQEQGTMNPPVVPSDTNVQQETVVAPDNVPETNEPTTTPNASETNEPTTTPTPETDMPETEIQCDHAWVELPATEPTCTESGLTRGEYCEHCDAVSVPQETIAALGHAPGSEATCTEDQVCTRCDEIVAAALGHTKGASPTCTMTQICMVCHTELAPALGHTIVKQEAVAATCTTAGKTEGS